jgi:hypothetical protein
MHKLGVITTWLGLILAVVGLLAGFVELFAHQESALVWLSLVPCGFVGLFVGVSLTQLTSH